MFIRVKKRDNGKRSVQIVESHRRGNKVGQQIVRHVGQALNDREEAVLRKLAESIIVEMKNNRRPVLPIFAPEQFYDPQLRKKQPVTEPIHLSHLREEQRVIVGIGEVFGKLYEDLRFNTLLTDTYKDKSWNSILKTCVLARLANPCSKRETASFLEQDYGIKIPLEKIYRMMDHVDACEGEIKKKVASSTLNLFGQKLNVVFCDVTTLYFESIQHNELKDFGFSKDCKFKEVQVVLSLVTTEQGMPLTYEVFPGNTFEGNTFIKTVEKLQSTYSVNEITVVTDRGLLSEKNLQWLEESGIKYIVGAKLKTMDKGTKAAILDEKDYRLSVVSEELHWLKEMEYKKRRLVISYSQKRATKDFKDRQRLVDRLLKKAKSGKIAIKDLIPNYGTKKYLKVTGGQALIDEDKMELDAQWDGLHGIISNSSDSPTVLLERYRNLWQIEESFRINKHDLKMRPIFHWKPERIRAHIAICFLAYTLARQAVYRVNQQTSSSPMSFRELRNELLHAQSSLLVDIKEKGNRKYLLPSKVTVRQRQIYKVFNLRRNEVPQQLLTAKEATMTT